MTVRTTLLATLTAPRRPTRSAGVAALVVSALLGLSACSGNGEAAVAPAVVDSGDWPAVLAQARGQTVSFYAYGGDTTLNGFLSGYVSQALAQKGVTLEQVKISDTADAINTMLGEKQAGRTSGGSVDAVWVNGENFATGRDRDLPSARYVDYTDPAVTHDFGVPVDGCEAVWQQASSALVYDSAALGSADVASVSSLLAWATAHPGRFTYPALPDFTGSMAVRTVLYDAIGGPGGLPATFDAASYAPAATALWARLNALAPSLWRGGATYPQSQEAVEKLYADGSISAYFTYGPGAVADRVRTGAFPSAPRSCRWRS